MSKEDRLKEAGFLDFEIDALIHIPFSVPYMSQTIAAREALYEGVKRQGWSDEEYRNHIIGMYDDNDWYTREGELSPHAYLRQFEHDYRDKNPAYQSPWQKARKKG